MAVPCPSEERLACFHEGTLSESDRAEVLAHVDTCVRALTSDAATLHEGCGALREGLAILEPFKGVKHAKAEALLASCK